MISLLGSALPVVLQIVGWFLGKSAASDEIKKKFLEFVSSYESGTGNAVRLGDSARDQLQKLKEELKDVGSTPQ
jgi:hypothetical protein